MKILKTYHCNRVIVLFSQYSSTFDKIHLASCVVAVSYFTFNVLLFLSLFIVKLRLSTRSKFIMMMMPVLNDI